MKKHINDNEYRTHLNPYPACKSRSWNVDDVLSIADWFSLFYATPGKVCKRCENHIKREIRVSAL